ARLGVIPMSCVARPRDRLSLIIGQLCRVSSLYQTEILIVRERGHAFGFAAGTISFSQYVFSQHEVGRYSVICSHGQAPPPLSALSTKAHGPLYIPEGCELFGQRTTGRRNRRMVPGASLMIVT